MSDATNPENLKNTFVIVNTEQSADKLPVTELFVMPGQGTENREIPGSRDG